MLEHPEIFYPCSKYSEKMNSLQPVYPLTTGVSNNLPAKTIRQALNCVEEVKEILPASIVKERNLVDVRTAFCGIHFPDTKEEYFAARNRLVFEEFLIFNTLASFGISTLQIVAKVLEPSPLVLAGVVTACKTPSTAINCVGNRVHPSWRPPKRRPTSCIWMPKRRFAA